MKPVVFIVVKTNLVKKETMIQRLMLDTCLLSLVTNIFQMDHQMYANDDMMSDVFTLE